MPLYDRLSPLVVEIDDYRLERTSVVVASGWERVTTTIVVAGRGHEGRGEDITYEAERHDVLASEPHLALAGTRTFAEASDDLAVESEPYTRWAFESAVLDLALRQAGRSLGDAIGRPYRPVRFVMSTGGDIRPWLAVDPTLEFKLDPQADWDADYIDAIAASDRVRVLDLKAFYSETVRLEPDLAFYRTCVERFPGALIEDPALELLGDLADARRRLSFDAIIHSAGDIERLGFDVRNMNIKPSRFGSVERLFEAIELCESRGIAMYGGGQFELGVGRGQIQALASLFYADAANDVAPPDYNVGRPRGGLPRSPLTAPSGAPGYR